jgi:hypothetical protein
VLEEPATAGDAGLQQQADHHIAEQQPRLAAMLLAPRRSGHR